MPPPFLLEAHVGVDLDDEQRLRRCVVDEIARAAARTATAGSAPATGGPLRRDQQRAHKARLVLDAHHICRLEL